MIIESQYLPPIDTFVAAYKYNGLTIEAYENYQKKGFRNRAHILGANGLLRLTVPLVKGKNNQMPIQEVRIDYSEAWQSNHIQSIRSAYGNAPYYIHYIDAIVGIIAQKHTYLYELNWALLKHFCKLLNINLNATDSYLRNPMQKDLRSQLKPNKPFVPNPTSYLQVFSQNQDFVSNLSILDLLFCKGPESTAYLKQLKLDTTL